MITRPGGWNPAIITLSYPETLTEQLSSAAARRNLFMPGNIFPQNFLHFYSKMGNDPLSMVLECRKYLEQLVQCIFECGGFIILFVWPHQSDRIMWALQTHLNEYVMTEKLEAGVEENKRNGDFYNGRRLFETSPPFSFFVNQECDLVWLPGVVQMFASIPFTIFLLVRIFLRH